MAEFSRGLWLRRGALVFFCAYMMLGSAYSMPESQRASEQEIEELMAACPLGGPLKAALPHPEMRYREQHIPKPATYFETLVFYFAKKPLVARESILRWYDFSRVLEEKSFRLGFSPEEFKEFRGQNSGKKGKDNLLFWYPHYENGFTHPAHFKVGAHFQFIVHAVVDYGNGITLMEHPEKISDLDLSTSLINEANVSTYASSGFILEVHPVLIYATSPRNAARNGESPLTMNSFFPVEEPSKILADSKGDMNEVDIVRNPGRKQMNITGLFLQARVSGKPWPVHSKRRIQAMRRYCEQEQLPVVPLPYSRF